MEIDPRTVRALERLVSRLGAGESDLSNLVQLAVLVANADGVIDETEMSALAAILDSVLGARVKTDFVRHFVNTAVREIRSQGLDACARSVGQWLSKLGAVEEGLGAALAIAYASDGLSRVERAVIETVGRAAGAAPDRIDALGGEFRAASPQG